MQAIIYKKVLRNYFLFCGFFLISIMVFNYYLDAGNQFYRANKVEEKLATAFLNKENIKYNANYNERGIHKLVLERLNERPEVLVLGSSRAMLINHTAFSHASFYNSWISSASLEDHLAIYYLYQKRGWQPDVLVIGLDPWLLDKNNNMKKWKIGFTAEYNEARKLLLGHEQPTPIKYFDQLNGLWVKYSQLLSFIYFKSSLLRYFSPSFINDGFLINPPGDACPTCDTRQADGTSFYPAIREKMTPTQIKSAALDAVSNFNNDFGEFTQLNQDYMTVFEAFVRHLTAHHVKVIFYLPPIAPYAYAIFKGNQDYKLIFAAEDYFIAIAEKYHATILGSYNPANLDLTMEDFLDGFHIKKQGLAKIFKPDGSLDRA